MDEDDDDFDSIVNEDYYARLGLSKKASLTEINNAYRRMSKIYHPDKHLSDPSKKEKAEILFNKIKIAHEILSDPHKKSIYDITGSKGLATEGWQIVTREKTTQEILLEFEKLKQDREQRLLEQKTNPRGSIVVGIDATDVFDRYDEIEGSSFTSELPNIEISQMSIGQSIEFPLTVKDTVSLQGQLSIKNGNGSGGIATTYRKITSNNGWAEVEISAGNGFGASFKCFRTLWERCYGTITASLQDTEKGTLRPSVILFTAYQLDKNIQGRITWNVLRPSSMQYGITYENDFNHLSTSLHVGIISSYIAASFIRKFPHHDFKLKSSVKYGTFGFLFEGGCEKKISKFSVLNASMTIGTPSGVVLKIRIFRGNMQFYFPIHLSENIEPSAMFYGTLVSLGSYFVIKNLLVLPFFKAKQKENIQKKKEEYLERLNEQKKHAINELELMKVTIDRSYEIELARKGLVIKTAYYGKLSGSSVQDTDFINVARQLQSLVKDSKLLLPSETNLSELPGFYDPCFGEMKELSIYYEFRDVAHYCIFDEKTLILIPKKEHIQDAIVS